MKIQGQEVPAQMIPGAREIKHCIAVASGKGGVGKSTVTAYLAKALHAQGAKVGVLDADIYGPSQTTLWEGSKGLEDELAPDGKVIPKGPRVENGMLIPQNCGGVLYISMAPMVTGDKAVVWRAPMATKALSQFLNARWGALDYLIVDLPPGTGDIHITLTQQLQLTGAILVTTPQKLSVQIAEKAIYMFKQVNVPLLGVIENMSGFVCSNCEHTTEIFKTGGGQLLANEHKAAFLGKLPLDPQVVELSDLGESLPKDSVSAKIFKGMAEKLKEVAEAAEVSVQQALPQQVDIQNGDIFLKFADGLSGQVSARDIRLKCPCASCVDENTGRAILKADHVPLDIKIKGIRPIGRYGLAFDFTYPHPSGIFRFSRLKDQLAQQKKLRDSGSIDL